MKISLQQIRTGFTGGYCYVHARSAMAPDGFTILTAQKLRLKRCAALDSTQLENLPEDLKPKRK